MENTKGETIIRGYHGTSLSRKVKVQFSICFLLVIVTTAAPLEVVDEYSVIPPPDITRHLRAVVLVGKEKWVPTRSPALMPLVGNVLAGFIKPHDYSVLMMVKTYHPLSWHWLNANWGHQENYKRETNVINDYKGYKEVIKESKNFLYESPRLQFKKTPFTEENADCIKETRARRREMSDINQQRY